jgi:hypothetical protein
VRSSDSRRRANAQRGKSNAGSGNDRRGGSMTCYSFPPTEALPQRQLGSGSR